MTLAASGIAFDDVRFDCSARSRRRTGPATRVGRSGMQMKGSLRRLVSCRYWNSTMERFELRSRAPASASSPLANGLLGRVGVGGRRKLNRCANFCAIFTNDGSVAICCAARRAGRGTRSVCAASDFSPLFGDNANAFLVGDALSLADITLLNLVLEFDFSAHDALVAHPISALLVAHRDKIAALPNIATYLNKRPDRRF
jgi:hypothetical protein